MINIIQYISISINDIIFIISFFIPSTMGFIFAHILFRMIGHKPRFIYYLELIFNMDDISRKMKGEKRAKLYLRLIIVSSIFAIFIIVFWILYSIL